MMNRLLTSISILAVLVNQASADVLLPNMGPAGAISDTNIIPVYQGSLPSLGATALQFKTYIGAGAAGVSSIAGATGPFNLGGGLQYQNTGGYNFLNQVSGNTSVLRNGSMVDWRHWTYLWGGWTGGFGMISINGITAATISNGSGSAGNQLNVSAAVVGSIEALGNIVGGSSYTPGTYTNVPLTYVSGSNAGVNAQATIVVNSSNVVSSVTITSHGTGYVAGDLLSANVANIGGTGSGFQVPVLTVSSIQLWQRITDAVNFTTNAITYAKGGVTALGTVTGGTGYANGTYLNVSLTDSTNTLSVGTLATVVVSGGSVSTVTITSGGANHIAGHILTAAASAIGGTGAGFSVIISTVAAASGTVLGFADTTNIGVGMYAYDVTNPTAIVGGITVASKDSTHVTMNTITSTDGAWAVQNPGVSAGDQIAFSYVQQGTQIIGDAKSGNCASFCTGSGGAGVYMVNVNQNVASEAMTAAGGYGPDGVYVIPVGPVGDYVSCTPFLGNGGGFTGGAMMQCRGGKGTNLTDLIIRFTMDMADTSRLTCDLAAPGTGSGQDQACVSGGGPTEHNQNQMPVTFHISLVQDYLNNLQPSIDARFSCPSSYARASDCQDNWRYTTTNLVQANFPRCYLFNLASCEYAYSWYPGGQFNLEVNYHVGALVPNGIFNLLGFDLKQTPGATCNGTPLQSAPYNAAPPTGCIQLNPGPLENPNVVYDQAWNQRFTKTWGAGAGSQWNAPGNQGPIETAMAYARSASTVVWSFPLGVQPRCSMWANTGIAPPTCPPPNAVFSWGKGGSAADLTFTTSASTSNATGVAVLKSGLNSIQFSGTFSGQTPGAVGDIDFNTSHGGVWMVDWSMIGD